MIYDLQKASLLKRFSAWLLDAILLIIVATGVAWVMSLVFRIDDYAAIIEQKQTAYETAAGVSFDISAEKYEAMTEEERAYIEAAYAEMWEDAEFAAAYYTQFYMTLSMVTLGILAAHLLAELLPALLFGNGQTVGKKIFGIGVMQVNGVKLTRFSLFVRVVLGKCTIETMVPAALIVAAPFGFGFTAVVVIAGILLLELILLVKTRTNSAIHDVLAYTVTVDLASQMIFESEQALLEYKQRIHAEAVAKAEY